MNLCTATFTDFMSLPCQTLKHFQIQTHWPQIQFLSALLLLFVGDQAYAQPKQAASLLPFSQHPLMPFHINHIVLNNMPYCYTEQCARLCQYFEIYDFMGVVVCTYSVASGHNTIQYIALLIAFPCSSTKCTYWNLLYMGGAYTLCCLCIYVHIHELTSFKLLACAVYK